jgi:hypothetical protein
VADGGEREVQGDAGVPAAGYERLRAAVLSDGAGGWRLGHGVLAARGMVAWMSAFGSLAPPVSVRGPQGVADPVAIEPARTRDADEVVAVLAQMTLAIAA